ncbi:MAG TPA: LTA synthase family protein [Massilibacterium sp.]|nr:LTA synthase family protein [Massilibacterium sp.]
MFKKVSSRLSLFLIATLLLWIKTYIVYKTEFNIPIDSSKQEFILFLNPLSTTLLFLGISLFFSGKWRNRLIVFFSFTGAFILFANMVYYRFFKDFITIPLLFQTSNFGALGGSILELIQGSDFLLFADVLILALLVWRGRFPYTIQGLKREGLIVLAAAVAIFFVNLSLAEKERPDLLTRSFDREMLVKNIGTFNYHIYDVFLQSKSKAQRAFADSSEITDVENYIKANYKQPNEEYTGIAKGRNVIVISMESTQSMVIDREIEGQEVTPFLNDLIRDPDTIYFSNFYHQTGQGKTSDAEFMLENSLYPMPRGAVFFTHGQNEYHATPKILKEYGYYSATLHANGKSFWNRNVMYDSLGYDRFFSDEDYEITDENSVNWGMKDIPFFEQSIAHLQSLKQPFYTKFITLTNHHPFYYDPEDQLIPEYTTEDGVVNRYFTTVRYTDESFKIFFDKLKESGLYDNSIIVIYGDHYGISDNHNKAMAEILGHEITPVDSAQLQKVPFIIHIPGSNKGQIVDTIGGQVDMRPTLMNLLGVDTKNEIQFGQDLLSKEHDNFTVFRDGSVITEEFVYTQTHCYDKESKLLIENAKCMPFVEKGNEQLQLSDKVIYGDLLRFYHRDK